MSFKLYQRKLSNFCLIGAVIISSIPRHIITEFQHIESP